MIQSIKPQPRPLLPLCVGAALLCLAPLPWSTRFLSYAHPKEALILALAALGMAAWLHTGCTAPQRRALTAYATLLLPVFAWFALALARGAAHGEVLAAAITGLGVLTAACMLAPLAQRPDTRRPLDLALLTGALLVALLALAQYTLGDRQSLFPVYAHYDQRIYSVFGNQDLLGGYMALALALLWARALQGPRAALLIAALAQLPLAAALLLSGCRSAWAAALVGLALAAYAQRHQWRRISLLAAPGALLLPLALLFAWDTTGARITRILHGTDIGGSVRLWIWDAALRMLAEHPLTGIGPARFAHESPRYMGDALAAVGDGVYAYNEAWAMHPHSEPLNLLAEGGLIGALLALLFLYTLSRRARIDHAWPALVTLAIFALVNDAWHSAPHALATLWLLACATTPPTQRQTTPRHASTLDAPATSAIPDSAQALPAHATPHAHANPARNTTPSRILPAAGFLAATTLAGLHATEVLHPSYQLTRAEEIAFAQQDPTHAYLRATAHPYTQAEAQLGLAVHYTHTREWPKAQAAAQAAIQAGIDTHMPHWLHAQAAYHQGDHKTAQTSLTTALHRAPKNRPTFNLLYKITPQHRPKLTQHATQWNLPLPQ